MKVITIEDARANAKKVYIEIISDENDKNYGRYAFVPYDVWKFYHYDFDNKSWATRKGAENWAAKHGYQIIGEW